MPIRYSLRRTLRSKTTITLFLFIMVFRALIVWGQPFSLCNLSTNMCFSKDGSSLCASAREKVYFIKVKPSYMLREIELPGIVTSSEISPNNKYIACGTRTGFYLYDIRKRHIIYTNDSWSLAASFSPDGKYIVYGKDIFTVKTKACQMIDESDFFAYRETKLWGVYALRQKVDKKWIVIVKTNGVTLYDHSKKRVAKWIDIDYIDNLFHDDRRVFTGGSKVFIFYRKSVVVIDFKSSKKRKIKYGFTSKLRYSSFCVSYDGKYFALADLKEIKDKALIFDAQNGQVVRKIDLEKDGLVNYLAICMKEGLIAVGYKKHNNKPKRIVVYNIDSGKKIRSFDN